MLLGAGWPIILTRSVSAQDETTVPDQTRAQFENTNVGGWYTCMAVAVDAQNTEDAKMFAALIRSMHTKLESVKRQHYDFMTLATRAAANLKSVERSDQFYEAVCRKPLEDVKQQASSPSK